MSVAESSVLSVSSLAVTVTVCAVLQFEVVKVRLAEVAVRSVPLVPPTVTVTFPVGALPELDGV